MHVRSIGSLRVSTVGLGGNNFGTQFFGRGCDQPTTTRIIHAALDSGVNFIDTAEEYSVATEYGIGHSEEYIGRALKGRRDDVVIATKFLNAVEGSNERGAARIVGAVEGSLNRLGIEHIDLLQQHKPDIETRLDETLEAMDRLVQAGKVREIGSCNFSGSMLDEAQARSAATRCARFVSTQNWFNVLEPPREAGVLEACARHDLVLIPFFPLANGVLTGKYRTGGTTPFSGRLAGTTSLSTRLREGSLSEAKSRCVDQLADFAAERGRTLIELAFGWLLSHDRVATVLAGATTPDQVRINAASASWEISREDLDAIDEIRLSCIALVGPDSDATHNKEIR